MNEQPAKRSSPLKWILACLGCGVLCLGSGGALVASVMWATQPLAVAVQEHVALVKAGKVSEAYDGLATEMRENTPLTAFESFAQEYAFLYSGDDLRIQGRRIQDDEGLIEGVVEAADGSEIGVRFRLVKEGQAWKVSYIGVGQDTDVPVAAAQEHVRLVASGQVEQAYEGCSPEFKASTSLEAFREFARAGVYSGTGLTFGQRKVAGDHAWLQGTVAVGGQQVPVTFELQRVEGGWRVRRIDLAPKSGE